MQIKIKAINEKGIEALNLLMKEKEAKDFIRNENTVIINNRKIEITFRALKTAYGEEEAKDGIIIGTYRKMEKEFKVTKEDIEVYI